MATVTISVKTNKDPNQFKVSNQSQQNITKLINLLSGLNVGALQGSIDIHGSSADPVAASGTFTVTSAVATDAITIGTVTLTASSTPANENQWEIDGATDADDAASLAAAINAHSVLSQVVTATSASNVVTVRAHAKGVVGNQIPISSADATIVASGAFLTGGTGGATGAPETIGK